MAQIDPPTDVIVGDWLSVPDVADRLGLPVSRVKQLLRDRRLLAVQRPTGETAVPARFLEGNEVIHGLGGTLTLLFDCGFTERDAEFHGGVAERARAHGKASRLRTGRRRELRGDGRA